MGKSKKFCIYCGKQMAGDAAFCPNCGKPVKASPEKESRIMDDPWEEPEKKSFPKPAIAVIIIAVIIILIVIVKLVSGSGDSNSGAADPEESVNTMESTSVSEPEEEIEPLDSNESNDTMESAIEIADGNTVSGYVDSAEDMDYFRVSADEDMNANLIFRHARDNDSNDAGWKISYMDGGQTKTEVIWLGDQQTSLEFQLSKGDNYICVSPDAEVSDETMEKLRTISYYISVELSPVQVEEEADEEEVEAVSTGGDFIISGSDSRYLTEADIEGMSVSSLRLARNEIYARHGRRFNDSSIQSYFDSQPWYNGTISPDSFDESVLNQYEKANIEFIRKHE